MKTTRYFLTIICLASMLSARAQFPTEQPQACFQSTSTMMSSGSTYASEVYAIGANSPSATPSGPRKAGGPGGTGGESTYDPNNPQFSPLGDALFPLLIMAFAFVGITYLRRKRTTLPMN